MLDVPEQKITFILFEENDMSGPFHSISVKSAELLVAKLTEINESGRLNKRWIEPVGYGKDIVPKQIEFIEKQIDKANRINNIIGTNEIKVLISRDVAFHTINSIFHQYEVYEREKA